MLVIRALIPRGFGIKKARLAAGLFLSYRAPLYQPTVTGHTLATSASATPSRIISRQQKPKVAPSTSAEAT